MTQKTVTFTITINEELVEPLSQFLKRVRWSEIRQCAVDDVELKKMRDGLDQVREAFLEAGYDPR